MLFAIREKNSKILQFFAPGSHNLKRKNDRNSFDWVFDNLSNAACRMSLRRSGTELYGGGGRINRPLARCVTIGAPARHGLSEMNCR